MVSTGPNAGKISAEKFNELVRSRNESSRRVQMLEGNPIGEQVLAVAIRGKAAESKDAKSDVLPINAVYVADADCLGAPFIDNRNQPDQYEDFNFHLQNVTFVLNVIDILAGEERFANIRRKEPKLTLEVDRDRGSGSATGRR